MSRILVLIGSVLIVYFLPTVIGLAKRNPDTYSIFAINLWLGWTVVGWITALGWALDHERRHNALR